MNLIARKWNLKYIDFKGQEYGQSIKIPLLEQQ